MIAFLSAAILAATPAAATPPAAATAAPAAAVPLAAMAGGDGVRLAACARLANMAADRAVAEAEAWNVRVRTAPSRQCLGLAHAAAAHWSEAATAFEDAAAAAEADRDGRAPDLWAQAGNAALAAEAPRKARDDLDHALGAPALTGQLRGEVLLDRARADVALADLGAARIDLDKGRDLVSADPFAWLLSASLARRQHDLDRAETDIGEALRLAPDDASVALEAGNIAAARGVIAAARTAWTRAAQLAPNLPEGQAATAALAANR